MITSYDLDNLVIELRLPHLKRTILGRKRTHLSKTKADELSTRPRKKGIIRKHRKRTKKIYSVPKRTKIRRNTQIYRDILHEDISYANEIITESINYGSDSIID
jgi:hypothetical protein